MPIVTQDIIDSIRQALDAEENSTAPNLGYYNDDKDIIPAINNGIKWFVNILDSFLEEKKFSSEILRELTYTRIFQTNLYSRVGFLSSALGHEVWTTMAVYPEPVMLPAIPSITSVSNATSLYRNDITYLSGTKSAKRLTVGEWNKNAMNPLEDGNLIFTPSNAPGLVSYAYLNASNYISSAYPGTTVPGEIEIRPAVSKGFVGVVYIATPTLATSGASLIQFPATAFNIIYEKALNLIAQKIGDQSTIKTTSDEELSQLVKSLM